MAETDKERADEFKKRHPWAASLAFEGPWTEADEIWVECLTGEYDERLEREAREREARDTGL